MSVGSRAQSRAVSPLRLRCIAGALLCVALAVPLDARAERQHIVKPGQSLEVIAKQYKLSATELAAANGLHADQALHRGQVLTVPPEGVVYVTNGQTLGGIAHEHGLSSNELARVNHIEPNATLHIGQRLLLPGFKASKLETASSKKWGTAKQHGVVSLYRIWSRETLTVHMIDAHGRVKPATQRMLRDFLRPRESNKRKLPNPRLLSLIADVSDHFGGRTIHVVSGYRLAGGLTRKTSRHVAGEAMDFSIPGVPLTEVRDYCQHFSNVGVGYYPRTLFVHLDVRVEPARWTDWSLPGQPAILREPVDFNEDRKADGSAARLLKNEDEIPEPPPAPDDGQPALDIPNTPDREPIHPTHKPRTLE